MGENTALLFLCVANSARSQMAEGLARRYARPGIDVYSAGSEPSTLNPHAVAALRDIDIDISDQCSKGLDAIPKDAVSVVITLCAEEVCPAYLGHAERLHWPHSDPAGAAEPAEAFRRVRDEIEAKVRALLNRRGWAAEPT